MAIAEIETESAEIRRRMAEIRRDLHLDIQEVVAGAEAVTDWRRYVRMYPWAAVGLAAAVGYLIVPKRHRSVPPDVARKSDVAAVRQMLEPEPEPAPKTTIVRSLANAAVGTLAPLAWRAAQNYALAYLEQWIAQQQQPPPPTGRPSDTGTTRTRPTGRPSP